MGKALINHKAGDVVDVYAPGGVIKVRIVTVK
jgi:transcription elongation GreA/GreB family factor